MSGESPDDGNGAPADADHDEVLYRSERTQVFRRHGADGAASIVCKELLGPQALERLQHETRILMRLAGMEGVPRLAEGAHPAHVMAMQDSEGVPLARSLQGAPLAVAQWLRLALQLTRIVAAVHRAGVVHKDINPANILLCGAQREPMLIDFHLASTFTEEQPGFTHHSDIAGTLAYLAPEQTGRTGRSVDQRADLYALGATFFEMATGQPPFVQDDALQMIHNHLAQVPTAPIVLNPGLAPQVSDLILRLLEKEPERRYQSAEGLAHDLSHIVQRLARDDRTPFALGQRDFAWRLSAPSRLVGRDPEIAALQAAFAMALRGAGQVVLVAGAPGVGKTALINTLRPLVTARRGWFVSGKFDQYLHDAPSATGQALRALGRLLLAEPEAELALQRERMLAALGANAGLITALLPEFLTLLGPQPEVPSIDPVAAAARLRLATLELLRAIVSPERPVVMVLDDLQWAGAVSIRFIDQVLGDASVPGLLLLGAYRAAEVDATHPLSALLPRWAGLPAPPLQLPLQNLPPAGLGALLAEMLRLAPAPAAQLAQAINANTEGNPFDTVELVNALRHDGALVPSEDGWRWDVDSIRRYIGHGNVVDLLGARIAQLPQPAQALLAVMACLGGELGLALLRTASGLCAAVLEEQLTAPLEDGLLVREPGIEALLRFRHDRVQQAAHGTLDARARAQLQLAMARRLAPCPGLERVAAEQYLATVGEIHDPLECRRAAALFRDAAEQARRCVNYATMDRYLASAIGLLERLQVKTAPDEGALAALHLERHAALYSLGRLDEADALYRAIEARGADVVARVEAAVAQMNSLSNRNRHREAVLLGRALLSALAIPIPDDADLSRTVAQGLDALHRWAWEGELAQDLQRPLAGDERVNAAGKIMAGMLGPTFFCDPTLAYWLALEAQRLWAAHGPCPPLIQPLAFCAVTLMALRQDYRTGFRIERHVIAVADARGFEPYTAQARFIGLFSEPWFEPLETCISLTQLTRTGLLQDGDLQFACFTPYISVPAMLDCAATLDLVATEVEPALAFAESMGNDFVMASLLTYRQLLRALRGTTRATGDFTDAEFDEAAYVAGLGANPMAAGFHHINRALAAAVFGDTPALIGHAAGAMPLLPYIEGYYHLALARVVQVLALAERLRAAGPVPDAALLAELDACLGWLAARAADAPMNFLHLQRWLEGERAWAVGDEIGAVRAFDAALREVARRQRPWHRALMTERAGLFHAGHDLAHHGQELLAEARELYAAWGASAKVREMERSHPFLRGWHGARRDSIGRSPDNSATISHGSHLRRDSLNVSIDAIDMLAILRASQALSSQTSLERLRARVVELLGEMTGATRVLIVLRRDEPPGWHLSAAGGADIAPVSVEDAGARGLLPLSAFRYAERTHEPLLVDDATRDDRFARDPYIEKLERCSLLVVPILSQGVARAVLLLENSLSRGAFAADRLDAVMLIAGQLAVSLDNALLYDSLERKVTQRTEALEQANQQLALLSITDPLTGLANRRRFNDVLEAEWLRALRTHTSIGAAMIDIDQFKLYNDHYGHQGGDACLKLVAATLGNSLRQGVDLVARYGGEEFAFILPGADQTATFRAAERACAAVVALQAPHATSIHGIVTVSIGVTAWVPTPEGRGEQLFAVADAALYEAKQNGRNRVLGKRMN